MNLEPLKKYLTTEKIQIPRQTVQGLLEVLESVLRKKPSPHKIVYVKGEGLYVERLLSKEFMEEGLATPYQIIRQYSEISIGNRSESIYKDLFSANVSLSERGCKTSCLVVFDKFALPQSIDLAKALQVPIIEDNDCPEGCIFVCGSSIDDNIDNIEHTILLRSEDV